MYFKYNINGKIIRTWYGYFKDVVDIENQKGETVAQLPIESDDKGEYFIYDDQKVYKNEFVKVSLEDFMTSVKNHMAFDNEFTTMLMSEGIDNIQLEVPMNTISGPVVFGVCFADAAEFKNKLCRITERNYKIEENHKIEVEVIDTIDKNTFLIVNNIAIQVSPLVNKLKKLFIILATDGKKYSLFLIQENT